MLVNPYWEGTSYGVALQTYITHDKAARSNLKLTTTRTLILSIHVNHLKRALDHVSLRLTGPLNIPGALPTIVNSCYTGNRSEAVGAKVYESATVTKIQYQGSDSFTIPIGGALDLDVTAAVLNNSFARPLIAFNLAANSHLLVANLVPINGVGNSPGTDFDIWQLNSVQEADDLTRTAGYGKLAGQVAILNEIWGY